VLEFGTPESEANAGGVGTTNADNCLPGGGVGAITDENLAGSNVYYVDWQ
jgi:hypothetical protein